MDQINYINKEPINWLTVAMLLLAETREKKKRDKRETRETQERDKRETRERQEKDKRETRERLEREKRETRDGAMAFCLS